MSNINNKIGGNLKKIRKSRGLTIDTLSISSTVSKSMISEIERGIRNPSISILWNLANALKTPLNYFLKDESSNVPVIYKMGDNPCIQGKTYSFHPLMNFDEDKKFEIYYNEYLPHSETEPSIHFDGVEEYTLVASGQIVLHLEGKKYIANEGEVIHFIGDKPHFYVNETNSSAKAFVIMFYSK